MKHYFQMSEEKLIQRVNADWQMQMFCGIQLDFARKIRDTDIIGRWSRYFGERLNVDTSQDVLAEFWRPYIENKHTLMNDTTCYESYIKYPTDVKLLYDCFERLFDQSVMLQN